MARLALLCVGVLLIPETCGFRQSRSAAQETPDDSKQTQPQPSPQIPNLSRLAKQIFARQDQNSDGKISPEEARGLLKVRFAGFDRDSDGFLDQTELEQGLSDLRIQGQATRGGEQFGQRESWSWPEHPRPKWDLSDDVLPGENLPGEGIWIDPALDRAADGPILVTVWFDRQFLGDGEAYARRSREFAGERRQELAARVVNTLKTLSRQSFEAAEPTMRKLIDDEQVRLVQWHWIVNGFSCVTTKENLPHLKAIPGVRKIFANPPTAAAGGNAGAKPTFIPPADKTPFDPEQYEHPWYVRYLQAEKTWKQLEVSGSGTLNVVMDFNFVFFPNVAGNLYRNPHEIPDNGKDDDGNGLIDDYHGYDFSSNSAALELTRANSVRNLGVIHGTFCAAEICGTGSEKCPYEFGLAPSANWAGVIAGWNREAAYEWAVEQGADTVSMSFSMPALGELRSHWRKMAEQAAFCGVCSVSGAGNFAQEGTGSYAPIPLQMRTPEDIPLAVFAPAGVQRDFQRTPFSSQGPVQWETEHYRDGLVQKPDFCAFNMQLPVIFPNETVLPAGASGNSFAGPMMAGTLALMLSADPDLLPWDAREILIQTATDVGDPGFDPQTGHGLLNCYRAVKEVLRRKAVRDGGDPKAYEGREENDELDIAAVQQELKRHRNVVLFSVLANSDAGKAGLRQGDVLQSIGDVEIEAQPDVTKAIEEAREAKRDKELFVIRRNGEKMEISVPIPATGPVGIAARETFEAPAFE